MVLSSLVLVCPAQPRTLSLGSCQWPGGHAAGGGPCTVPRVSRAQRHGEGCLERPGAAASASGLAVPAAPKWRGDFSCDVMTWRGGKEPISYQEQKFTEGLGGSLQVPWSPVSLAMTPDNSR